MLWQRAVPTQPLSTTRPHHPHPLPFPQARDCLAGSRVKADPTATTDRVCESCIANVNYQDATNVASCKPVGTCGAGQLETASPTLSTARLCGPCPERSYQPRTAHTDSTCQPHRVCAAGTYVSLQGTPTSDAVCSSCPPDTFQPLTHQPSCSNVSLCTAGQRQGQAPTTSGDRTARRRPR